MKSRPARKIIGYRLVALLALIFFLPLSASAQLAESLYVDSSFSSRPITDEINCHGAPDGAVASIDTNLANYEYWSFDFDNTANPGEVITSAQIFITHRQSGYVDDTLAFEYFDGVDFIQFESFENVPTTMTTMGPFNADSIVTTGQLDGFQVRMRGINHTEPPDRISYYVDAVELRITYEINEAPILDPIPPQTVDEGGHLDVRVTASDPDIGDIIALTAENLPPNASFSDSTGGVGGLTFDPDYTQAGSYQVDIIATDLGGLADTGVVDITVNDVDLPPVLDAIPPQTVDEGAHLDLRVTATDPDGDVITLVAELLSPNMAFADSSGGVEGLTFDPDYTQSGLHQVRFIANSNSLADTQLVDITVTDVDRPPVLDPISPQTVAEGGHLDLRVTALDADGDPIGLVAELLPPNSAFFDSTGGVGGFTFDPDYTQSGLHQVRFIANSNSLADTQLVDITVTEVDRRPVLDPISPQTVAEGGHLDLRVTASDPDGDIITLAAELLSPNMVFADSSGGVGGLTFDPDYTQSGLHQVRFIANSNSLADTQFVEITVNDVDLPPVLDAIPPQTVDEGAHLDLRVTATDPDGDVITLVAELLSPNMAFADSSGGVGGLTFDPDYTQSGLHQVRFIANSNSLADTQLVDITVTEVDRPLVLDPISPQTMDEGGHLDLRVTATDPDGDVIALIAELLSPNMVFADSSGGVGGLTFDPDYTQSGLHQVRFIASSNSLADTQIVDITVTEVDLPPVLDPISPQTVVEGGHLDLRVTASDPDGDAITLVAELLSPNMAFADSSGGVGGLTFDPDYTQSGLHQVRFIASSNSLADTQLVDITVSNVDLPPVLDPISPQTVVEGDHLDLRVTATDPDGDVIALVAELLSPNMVFFDSSGGVGGLTFDPDYTQSGLHQVRFIASSNSLADTQLVDITVTDVDRPPVLDLISPQTVVEGGHLDLRVTATDPDGDVITLVAELLSPNMVFADSSGGVGGLTFDPDYTQSGLHQVRFIASSNALADTQLVDITVTDVDLPPVLDPISPQTVVEGGHLDLRITSTDPDGDVITLVAELLSPNMAFADSSGGVGGLTFDPDYTQSGLHQVRFIASSNSLADTQLVDITVSNVDLPPVLDPISPQTVVEGGHLDLRITATDPDGDIITLVAELLSPNMVFADSSGGVGGLTFDPDYTQSGLHQVRFIASSNSLADTQLVDITVSNVDLPPVLDPISPQTVAEGGHLDLRVTASDPDGDVITLIAELLSPNMVFADSSGGVGGFVFDPDYTQSGLHQVRFIASSNSLADTQIVDITVNNVDLPPVLDPISPQTVVEGGHLDLRITATDPDGDIITLVAELLSPNMVFADSSGGVGGLTFDPDYTQSGLHQVRFIASSNSLADTQLVDITVNNVDLPPVLDPISPQTVAEGGHLDLRVTASDPDGDPIGLVAELLPPNSAFFDSTGGVGGLTFDPDYTQSGLHQVRFIASSNSLADTQLVDITVTNVDLPPVLDPISPQTVAEGGHLDLRVTASDPDGDVITLVAELLSPNMVFADSSGGVGGLTFDPDYTQSGLHQVRFIASSNSLADTQLVDITVTEVDLPPVLDPISPQTVVEGGHLDLRITSTDPDGDVITLVAELLSPNMAFADSSGGVGGLTFDPDYTQSGLHQVRFIASSNSLADTQLVDITVKNVDLPPVLDPISPQTVAEGGHLDLRITATDPDGDIITLVAELLSPNMVFADSSGGVGGLTFDPDYTQSGLHQVRFIASSNSLADTQIVDITVNNVDLPPVLDPISPQTVVEGGHLDLRITATDPDGDVITLVAELLSPNMVFADSSGGVGGLTFDPDYTQSGLHQVRFIASSNSLADTQIVDITVNNVDLPPVLDPISPQTVAEGGHLDLRITATDPDGDVIALVAELLSPNMAFADSSGGVGGLTFDPDYTQSGLHQVRFIASSNSLADTQLVDITVNNVDLPPVLDPISPQTVVEGGHLDLRITATDPDGDIITLVAELLSPNMVFADSSGGVGGLTFDPDYTQSGLHQVRFIASSNSLADTQLVDITVNNVDLPPVLDPISPQTVDEGGHLDLRVTASDFDGDPIALSAEGLPANANFADSSNGVGGFTFDPDFFQSGDYTVSFVAVSNTLADTEFVDITVNNVNRAPVLNPIGNRSVIEGGGISFEVTASDPDLATPSLIAEDLPPNANFVDSSDGTGQFTFNPDYTQTGTYYILFIATDGDLADSELVQITVFDAGNQPPEIDHIGPQSIYEGNHLELLVTASDPDGTIPALQGLNLPSNSAFVDSGNGNASFTFDPDYTQAGVYNVLFRAYDGGLYDSLWVGITVLDSNRAPVLSPIGPQTVTEGSRLQFVVTSSDPDGTTPQLSADPLPANAVFEDSLNGHGLFTFDPDFTQSGINTVLFIASDGPLADSEFVEITILEFGNNPPVLDPIGPQSVDEGALLQVVVSASDLDGTIPSLVAEDLPPNAVFTDSLNGRGLFEFSPSYFQSGIYPVRFIASDGALADSEIVDITVNNIDRPPLLDPISPQTVAEGGHLDLRVTASDPDGDPIGLVAELLPANSAFFDSTGGVGGFIFDPDYTQSGLHQVRFIASSNSLADTQLVDITVTDVDRPPVLDPISPQTVAEGGHLDLRVTASDPDGGVITLVAELLSPNMIFADSSGGVGGFVFDPDYTQSGLHQVRFIANSNSLADTQLVDITVTEVDRSPVLDPISPQTVAEGGHLDLRVTASDPDGDPIGLIAELLPPNSAFYDSTGGVGGLTFDPDYTQSGLHQVRFIASSNSLADTQLVDITVVEFDLPPVLDPISPQTVAEGGHLDLRVTASDPDGDPIALVAELLPANSAFYDSTGGVGGFVFDPDYTQSGLHQVRFIASSNSLADTQLVDVTVTNVDLPPVLDPISPQTVAEGGHLDLRVTASDPDGDPIGLVAELLPANSAFFDSTGGVGGFTFDPDYTQSGLHQVRFIANSNSLADTQLVDITVTELDRPPVLDPISPQTVTEGGHLDLRVTASDPDGDIIGLVAELLPANSAFLDSTGGVGGFTFDPDYTQSGLHQVRFIASSNSLADTQLADITVTEVDRPPVLDPISPQTVAEGDHLDLRVTATDPDGDPIGLVAELLSPNMVFADSTGGVGGFSFDPDYTQSGLHQVRFIASSNSLADTQLVDITVTDVDLPPILDPISPQTVAEGGHLDLRVTASDPDGDPIGLIAELLPPNSAFYDSTGGVGGFTFDPDYGQSGLYEVRFIASSNALADTQLVDITVVEFDLPPVLDPISPQTVAEGGHLDLRVTASDPDGDVIGLVAELLPPNSAFFDSTGGVGGFTFDPDYTQSGLHQVRFIANSNSLADTQLVDITVTEVDLPPILDPISPQTVAEGGHLDLRVTASDADGDPIGLVAELLPANSAFFDSTGGVGGLTFDPDYTQSGLHQVRFIANSNSLADTQLVDITVTELDRAPVLDPISPQTVAEGDHLDLLVTASDPDGDVITLVAELLSPNMAFFDSTGGVGGFTFDPDYTQSGLHQVRFIASSNSLADTQLVDITVTEVDLPPVLDPISPQTVAEGGHLDLRVTASDPDGDVITLIAELLSPNMVFADSSGGVGGLTFDPDYTQSGLHQVRFIASSNSLADTQLVDITVFEAGDQPPVWDPILPQTVAEGDHLDLRVTATDPEGDIITLTAELLPANSAFFDSTGGVGGFVFDPDFFQAGLHQVRFIATANALSDTALVDITVDNVNRAPLWDPISDRALFEGETISFGVSATDPDLTIPLLWVEDLPVNAVFVDSLNGRGRFSFSPDYTQAGQYILTFIASDGDLADSEEVDIWVFEAGNQPPEIDSIAPQSVVEGEHLEFVVISSDPDGTIPALQAFNLPANAVFADSGNGHGLFTFDPDYTQSGVYNVLFRAFDGELYDSLYVEITVVDFGFPPELDPIGPQTVTEGDTLTVVVTASDPDGTIPQLLTGPLPVNAVFEDSLNGHGLFTFMPDYTQSGFDTVLFIATDGALSDSEYVEIKIAEAGNQPPTLNPIGPQVVDEGDTLAVIISASDPDSTIPELSAVGLPSNATFSDNLDGTGTFEFRPDYTQAGLDTVLFIAADTSLADSEYVEITIYNVNLPPILTPIGPQSTDEGVLLQILVTATDPDGTIPSLSAEPLPLNATFVDSSNGTGLFEFLPDFDQAGVYYVLFVASDGLLPDSELVEITVHDVNLPPIFDPVGDQIVTEGDSLFFTVHAVDPEGMIPSLSVDLLPFNAVFTDSTNGTGLYEYRPSYTQSGADTIAFFASDGMLTDTLKVQITTLEAGNQPPVLAPIGPRVVDEGQLLQFNVYGSDADDGPPSLQVGSLPLGATFYDSTNGVGTFTFTPDFFQSGTYNVLFFATDGALADSEYVQVTVNNVNRPPELSPIGNQAIFEGDSLGLDIMASDLDGDSLVITAEPLEVNMSFVDNGDGTAFFQFMPDFTQAGIYLITFAVTDGVDADTDLVQIEIIEAGNQLPVLAPVDTAYYITEGYLLEIPVSATDLDGDSLVLSADSLVDNMTFVDNGDGSGLFTFAPSYVQSGTYPVTFKVFDNQDYDSAQTIIYVAEEGNQPPILDPIGPQTVAEGDSLVLDISATDPEGFPPVLLVSGQPDSSYFTDNGDGTGRFIYYPDFYSAGIYAVRFTALDNYGLTDFEDVLITVTDVNLPPFIVFDGDTLVHEGDTLVATVIATDSSDYEPGPISLSHGYLPPNSDFVITDNGVGEFRFYPDYEQTGVDSAYFYAVDSDNPPMSDDIWVRLTVLGSNRPPVLEQPQGGSVNQGDILTIDLFATDPDGDSIVLFINCDCPDPLPPRSEFHDFGDGTGQFIFYPDFTQTGIFIIYFAATDGEYVDTKPTLVQVIDMGNQPPTLNPIGPLSVVEGDSLEVLISATDPDSTFPAFTVEGAPYNLVLTDSSNGYGVLSYGPFYNQSGVYNMLIIADDGEGYADSEYVDLTVIEAGNQYPELEPISDQTITEGDILEFSVFASDPDSTIPIMDAHNLPENSEFSDLGDGSGQFSFNPSFFQSGEYLVTFLAIDMEDAAIADSQIVTITVVDLNRPPEFDHIGPFNVLEGQNLNFAVVSSDPDSTIPALEVLISPPNSSFVDNGDGTGTFDFNPDYFQAGLDSALFLAVDETDPELTDEMMVYIIIEDVNRPPVLLPIPDTTIGDGFMLHLDIVTTDPDLTIPLLFNRDVPDSAEFTDYGDGTALFSWRPRFEDIGAYQITFGCYDQMDSSLADSQIVNVEVITSGNHPPVFVPIPDQQVNADDTLDLLIVAMDPENDPITLSYVETLPFGMTFVDSGGGIGSLHWVPTMDQGGDTTVTLVATESFGLTDTLRVNITVITYIRGDIDADGIINLADVILLVAYYRGGAEIPEPLDRADVNGDGTIGDMSDIIYLIAYVRGEGDPPPPPSPPDGGRLGVVPRDVMDYGLRRGGQR